MKKILFSLALLVTFGWNAMSQETTLTPANPNAPVISFEQSEHDYGTIYQNGDGNYTFVYSNNGKEPLILSRVKSSCGCTIPKWSRTPLMPGQTDSINVQYDTKRLGSFNKTITVTSNATVTDVVLKIKGQVIPEPTSAIPANNVDSEMSPINK
jgi:hypothetical protein